MMPLKQVNRLHHCQKPVDFKRSYTCSNDLFKNVESIQNAIIMIAKPDPFNGLLYDFTLLDDTEMFKESRVFKKILLSRIEAKKEQGAHVFGLKIPSNEGEIMKVAIECGFRHHQANHEYSLLNLCLKGHSVNECSFPSFKTISAGVTAVVFDSTFKHFIAVSEKTGITKPKPVTGGIDYGINQDTPLKTAVRELKEEVNIVVKEEDAVLVGAGWTNNYRQNNPDISYIFAFQLKEMQKLAPQESEIEKAVWMSVEDFAVLPEEEIEKPWPLRNAVFSALKALKNNQAGWKKQTHYLTTGKPVEFYGVAHTKTVLKKIKGKNCQVIDFE